MEKTLFDDNPSVEKLRRKLNKLLRVESGDNDRVKDV